MTATEDRNARLASLQSNDPPSTNELVALRLKIAELETSVERLISVQKSITEGVGVLVATPLPPDNSSQVETLTLEIKTLAGNVETLASNPPHRSGTGSSAIPPDLTKAVTEAVDAAVSRAQRAAVPVREWEISEDLRVAMIAAEKLSASLTRAAWSRLALVAVPYAVVAVLLWMLVIPIAEAFGLGPLSRWAWDSFETADTAGVRLGIVAATFTVLAGLGYGIYRGGKKLADIYRGWR